MAVALPVMFKLPRIVEEAESVPMMKLEVVAETPAEG